MQARDMALQIAKLLDQKKAQDIQVLKVENVSSLTDYFIICTGSSTPQIQALADEVEDKMAAVGKRPLHVEGYRDATWVLLDYGDVVVHIFHTQSRGFYSLERLWQDAPQEDLTGILSE